MVSLLFVSLVCFTNVNGKFDNSVICFVYVVFVLHFMVLMTTDNHPYFSLTTDKLVLLTTDKP